MFVINYQIILWIVIFISWILISITIFYILFSYVIKTPKYLETEEAIKQVNDELQAEKERKERIQNRTITKTTSINSLESKLKKLKELKNQDLITEEEYKEKKAELLDNSI